MKSILISTKIALVGLLIFTNAFAQSVIEFPKQEIPAEYEFSAKIGDTIPIFVDFDQWEENIFKGLERKSCDASVHCKLVWRLSKEIPFIEKDIWQIHKRNPDFLLFGVDRDEPLEKVKKYQKEMDITYPLAIDPLADVFGLFADKKAGVTRNVIIDQKERSFI